ncbi:MAG: hypothetical protein ACPHK0_00720 [Dehalococcoidia bacterium]
MTEKVSTLIGVSIAGVVAEVFGLRVALAIGSIIWLLAGAVYLLPAVRSIKLLPESPVNVEQD